jgi:prepilin-type N-terminal cleavage/methylation domain-containing protein/prepilin-type processing-associated H-X9-DG protein
MAGSTSYAYAAGRRAMTLLEFMVAMAVIAVLVGLLLTAVQAVRAAAARTSCQNNLKQIGIAVQSYEGAHQAIPLGFCGRADGRDLCFSPHAHLLPFLDGDTTHQQIDWADQTLDFPGSRPAASTANQPLLTTGPSWMRCPSDPMTEPGMTNYRLSTGWSFVAATATPGAKLDVLPGRLAGFTDGLSNTALYSERTVGAPGGGARNAIIVSAPLQELAPACAEAQMGATPPVAGDPFVGWSWLRGSDRHTRYTQLLPPNSRLLDCDSAALIGISLMTARSLHAGGVNVLYADGRVAFVSNAVNLATWRAAGTPAGGEVANAE